MKKITSLFLSFALFFSLNTICFAGYEGKNVAEYDSAVNAEFDFDASAVYLCEASTGKVLYAENEYFAQSPASVTKIMTLLLVCEALDAGRFSLDDKVSISSRAASMGGSQVFLEEGERITVEELIKCTVIASGNDSAVALAELTSGSESSFVKLMNKRAIELGLKNTSFENATGLDDTTVNHYSCAADIATMSRELIKHEIILKYSSLWQDSIRDGEFTLTNTNRLVRFYEGCNGLKTGSTDKAGFCVSTTAKRGNLQLIAVVMGAETREKRNEAARELLDFGFANYALLELGGEFLENCDVLFGKTDAVPLASTKFCTVIEKDKLERVEKIYEIPETLTAPIKKGDVVGRIIYKSDGLQVGFSEVIADDDVEKISIFDLFVRILERIIFSY